MAQTDVGQTTAAERAARLLAVAQAASDNGRPAQAARHLRTGLRLLGPHASGEDQLAAEARGRLLVSLAWAESERGRVDLGFRLLDDAEQVVATEQYPVLLAQRALLLKRAWRNEQALAQFDRAVALLGEQSHPLDLVKALNNRGMVHLELGQVAPARADLRRAEQIATGEGLHLYAMVIRVNLGCVEVIAGDLPASLAAFTAARAEYRHRAPGRLASLSVELARALVAAGLFSDADRELAFAVEQASQWQLSHTYADALQVRAEVALLAGRPRQAAQFARQARARFAGRDNTRRAALALLLELRADQAAGDRLATLAGRARALAARLRRLGLPEDARVAGYVLARALVAAGRAAPAARTVDRYGRPGRLDRLDTRLLWRLARAEVDIATGRTADAFRHLRAGMAALHRHRTQFGCLDLQTGAAVHGQDLAQTGLAAALRSRSPASVYRWSERVRAQAMLLPPVRPPEDPDAAAALEELRSLQQAVRAAQVAGRPAGNLLGRVAALQRTVREHAWSTPGQRAAAGSAPAPLAQVAGQLGAAVLVSYLRHGSALHVLAVRDGSASLVAMGDYAVAEEAARRLCADLDVQMGRAMPRRVADAVASATRRDAAVLASIVLDPVRHLVGDRALVVVPTGSLMTVPWSALPGCTGRPVTVAPSATAWSAAHHRVTSDRPEGDCPRAPAELLVAGPGVAHAEAELAAIAAYYPAATVLSGPAATPAATLAALDVASIAHIAAHGHHQPEHPLFSTLELAGGPLMGYDLPNLRRPPHTVVLSCCDLGLTAVRPGDETLGMVTALLAAGTATVVANVSRVADEVARETMAAYHRAAAGGQAPAAALATATAIGPATGFVCFGTG